MRSAASNEVVQEKEELRKQKKRVINARAANSSYVSRCLDFKVTAERLELLIKYAPDAE